MKGLKHCVQTLLFVSLSIVSIVAPSGVANAASDYDDFLQVTPTLYVYTDGAAKTQTMDISTTWWSDFKQTYAKRVAQNIPGWPTNFVTEFEDIMASGGSWGVYTAESTEGIVVTIIGTHDPNAYCGFVGSVSSGDFVCKSNPGYGYVVAGSFTHNSFGGNGCIGGGDNRCSDNGMNIYAAPYVESGTSGYSIAGVPNSVMSSHKFFFMNFDINYPDGYEGQMIPSLYVPPPAKYVAMGDSFSSGEGNGLFEPGTDEPGVNMCHRSGYAYPHWLNQTTSLGLEPMDFVACSSATTENILNVQGNEPAQTDALSDETEVVTITIGGNDIGFVDFATRCVEPRSSCGRTSVVYISTLAKIVTTLPTRMRNVLMGIANATDHADVYVIGYPHITPSTELNNLPVQCNYLTRSESLAARDVVDRLNSVLSTAVSGFVNDVSDTTFTFINPNDSVDGTFEGHDVCKGPDAYFYNVTPNDLFGNGYRARIFHPNAAGQHEYYSIISGEIANNRVNNN